MLPCCHGDPRRTRFPHAAFTTTSLQERTEYHRVDSTASSEAALPNLAARSRENNEGAQSWNHLLKLGDCLPGVRLLSSAPCATPLEALMDTPSGTSWLKAMGPGILFAGAAIGGSHLVQ